MVLGEEIKLSFWQKILLILGGRIYIGHHQRSGWRGPLPFYVFHCKEHGYMVDYPHGWYDRLDCVKCSREREK